MFRPVGRSAPDDLPADDDAADVATLVFCIGMISVALLVTKVVVNFRPLVSWSSRYLLLCFRELFSLSRVFPALRVA